MGETSGSGGWNMCHSHRSPQELFSQHRQLYLIIDNFREVKVATAVGDGGVLSARVVWGTHEWGGSRSSRWITTPRHERREGVCYFWSALLVVRCSCHGHGQSSSQVRVDQAVTSLPLESDGFSASAKNPNDLNTWQLNADFTCTRL